MGRYQTLVSGPRGLREGWLVEREARRTKQMKKQDCKVLVSIEVGRVSTRNRVLASTLSRAAVLVAGKQVPSTLATPQKERENRYQVLGWRDSRTIAA